MGRWPSPTQARELLVKSHLHALVSTCLPCCPPLRHGSVPRASWLESEAEKSKYATSYSPLPSSGTSSSYGTLSATQAASGRLGEWCGSLPAQCEPLQSFHGTQFQSPDILGKCAQFFPRELSGLHDLYAMIIHVSRVFFF